MMHRHHYHRQLAGSALASLCLLLPYAAAHAQYLWIDDKGVKQFSDRPPPPNVPDKRILKAPGKASFNPDASVPEDAAAPVRGTPTLAERESAYQQRRAEAREASDKAAEQSRQRAAQTANCEIAQKNQQAIADGIRIATYDKNGERHFMTDAERAEQEKNNRKVLAGCK